MLFDELLESHVSGNFPKVENDVDFLREIKPLRKGAVALDLVAGRPRTCQLSLKLAQLVLQLLFKHLLFASFDTDETLGAKNARDLLLHVNDFLNNCFEGAEDLGKFDPAGFFLIEHLVAGGHVDQLDQPTAQIVHHDCLDRKLEY